MIHNITLSADEKLIELARKRAANEHRSLNDAFREWMAQWTGYEEPGDRFDDLMSKLDQIDAGRSFSRDELNAR
jgi:hypothetical protein